MLPSLLKASTSTTGLSSFLHSALISERTGWIILKSIENILQYCPSKNENFPWLCLAVTIFPCSTAKFQHGFTLFTISKSSNPFPFWTLFIWAFPLLGAKISLVKNSTSFTAKSRVCVFLLFLMAYHKIYLINWLIDFLSSTCCSILGIIPQISSLPPVISSNLKILIIWRWFQIYLSSLDLCP